MQEALFEQAYRCTRKLLVPSLEQLDHIAYPRIVLLAGLDDTHTALQWTTPDGDLWDNQCGFRMFHREIIGSDGSPAVSKILVRSGTHLTLAIACLVRTPRDTRIPLPLLS